MFRNRSGSILLPFITTACLLASSTSMAQGGNQNPGVIPANAHFGGYSYPEWVGKWAQWMYSTVTLPHSPFSDVTGENAAVGQSGKVWFLPWAARLPKGDWPIRTLRLPSGTGLLIADTIAYQGTWTGLFWGGGSVDALRADAQAPLKPGGAAN